MLGRGHRGQTEMDIPCTSSYFSHLSARGTDGRLEAVHRAQRPTRRISPDPAALR